MHQISEPVIPTKISRGGRISSPKLRATLQQSEDFSGLEKDVNRYDLLILVKRVGKAAGFTAKMINLLDYYFSFCKDLDWEAGATPIVYQSLSRTALDLGVSERQIQRLEKSLHEVGAITWNDSGNHRRFGKRCPDTGRILFAFGVDLSPLVCLKPKLEELLHEKQLRDQAWIETKRQVSYYRRQIKACIAELIDGVGTVDEINTFTSQYDDIATKIKAHMDLSKVRSLLKDHKKLHENILSLLGANNETANDETSAERTKKNVTPGRQKCRPL